MQRSHVFPRLDVPYPVVESGAGVWLRTTEGRSILDGCSGGAMVACLGHGVPALIEAAYRQALAVPYTYNHHFTNAPQERLAERLTEVVAPTMARARLVTGGSEANETALRLARAYHVERGETERWRVVSTGQAYHGSTVGALGLTGRRSVQGPYGPYLADQLHIPPSRPGTDPDGALALAELDRLLERVGAGTIAAFLCEPVGGASLPAHTPPAAFWEGLAERRERHGFLVCFDEIVSGIGRTGSWLAAEALPISPDVVTIGKGLGGGQAPLAAALCAEHVYAAVAAGSREFDLGHTWDGAPLPCAVGLATLDYIEEHGLLARVAADGPGLRDDLAAALADLAIVGEVRGAGFLCGVELVDPRDRRSPLPAGLGVAELVDRTALEHDLLVTSSASSGDGYVPDQVLLAPAFTASAAELAAILERLATALREVEAAVADGLEAAPLGDEGEG